jgi:hypothetical protein
MGLGFLDLNDCSLELWHQSNSTPSPGYALLENNTYVFGEEARAAARLKPRDINTRYWWQLSTEPLQPSMGPARHPGDLAHAHLSDLHQRTGSPEEVLIAVPGSMQNDQLSLLLGIAQHSSFNAVGMVNRSVALASLHATEGYLWHLEVQLHQLFLSRLTRREGDILLDRSMTLPSRGLIQTQERLASLIAEAFVEQTRFDPRQKAETEQALYNALPSTLRALQHAAETNLEVEGHVARIAAKDLESIGSELLTSVSSAIDDPDSTIIADPIFGLLPGAGNTFQNLHILPPGEIHRALKKHQSGLIQEATSLHYVTSLPVKSAIAPKAANNSPGESNRNNIPQPDTQHPTHLLCQATATPLPAQGITLAGGIQILQEDGEWRINHNGQAITVNGQEYSPGTALGCGDVLMLEDQSYTLIQVEG